MEMMAVNPQMVKMASDQMKKLSRDKIKRMQEQMTNNGSSPKPSAAVGITTSTSSATHPALNAAHIMENVTLEQMTEQAKMFKNTDPDTIRRMRPHLANMSDDQIKAVATQFEMMASNPELMKMSLDQMKNMSPDKMQQTTNLQGATYSLSDMNNLGVNPSKILANIDKKQMKQMLLPKSKKIQK